ncbi:hypothetical protein [Synechococcus elongatus]|uniref:hypothetical protein n=1 Tax=Synechococcus elongatus TaxID=32046 RepID=UPI003CC81DE6
MATALQEPLVDLLRLFGKPDMRPQRRMVALARDTSVEAARAKADRAAAQVTVQPG